MSTEPHIGQEETDERRRILERGRLSVSLDISPVDKVMQQVRRELDSARRKFAPMHSPHEGHSVIREEFDELWKHVMEDTGYSDEAREEAIQLAAMAMRYVVDICDSVEPPR